MKRNIGIVCFYTLIINVIAFIFYFSCTKVEYDNPFDPDGMYQGHPVIKLLGPDTVYVTIDTKYREPGFAVYDDKDNLGELHDKVKITIKDQDNNDVSISELPKKLGTYYALYDVTDTENKPAETKKRAIVVTTEDKEAPVITLQGPVPFVLNVGDSYKDPGADAIDNVDGDISKFIDINTNDVKTTIPGTYYVAYYVVDKAQNEAHAKREVIVKAVTGDDTEKPVITLIGSNPMVLMTNEVYTDPGATATDNKDGDITGKIRKYGNSFSTALPDSHVVYYVVEDVAGNIAQATRTVQVRLNKDTIAPVITLVGGSVELKLDDPFNDPGYSAIDDPGGKDITDRVVRVVKDASGAEKDISDFTKVKGTYTIYYNVTDDGGNKAREKTRKVNVDISSDITPPKIYLLGSNPMNVKQGDPYIEPGVYAIDDVDPDTIPNDKIEKIGGVTTNILGTYTLYYRAYDKANNMAETSRVVFVIPKDIKDTIPPVISVKGSNPINISVGYKYTEQGASAWDNVDGDLTSGLKTSYLDSNSVTIPWVDTTKVGKYYAKYEATDKAGNTGSGIRIVNVLQMQDTTKPLITLKGKNPLTLFLNQAYVEYGATALDPFDGPIPEDSIKITGTVNSSTAGNYTKTYTVSDKAGNTGTAKRSVKVLTIKDTTKPIITILGSNPVNIKVNDPYTDAGATAYDSVDGNLTSSIQTTNKVNNTVQGTYTVDYRVSDKTGNTTTKSRTVTVTGTTVDTTRPVITLKGSNPMGVQVHKPYIEPGATATDNVDGNVTSNIAITGKVDTSKIGADTITYTVSDKAGNTAVKKRTVNVVGVVDTTKPVITLTGSNPMTVEINKTYVEPGATATDNIDGNISSKIVITGTVDISKVGTYTRTYNVTDNSGNAAVPKTRTVNVVSSIVPEWKVGTTYAVNDKVTYQSKIYKCIQPHTAAVGWEPPNAPALWTPSSLRSIR